MTARAEGSSQRGLNKPLAEMSDRELEEELLRRRQARASARQDAAPITDVERRMLERFEQDRLAEEPALRTGVAAAIDRVDLGKYYAALELKAGATLAEVQTRYRDLMAKYHPDKHAGDPDKHATATRLVQELTRAYQVLTDRLARR
jgi:DnaJ-domain-containing protein 1